MSTHHIASHYDEKASHIHERHSQVPLKRFVERFTFFKMLGHIDGKDILDLACGAGIYTRMIKQRGAARVVGVDVSEPMLHMAHHHEHAHPMGIEYILSDASEMGLIGQFDVVSSEQLFHFADTKEQIEAICQNIHDNLKPGGRFVYVGFSPFPQLESPNMRKYSFDLHYKENMKDGDVLSGNFFLEDSDEPALKITHLYWTPRTYEWSLRKAGMRNISWHLPEVSPEGIELLGAEYWEDFLYYPFHIGLTCTRPS